MTTDTSTQNPVNDVDGTEDRSPEARLERLEAITSKWGKEQGKTREALSEIQTTLEGLKPPAPDTKKEGGTEGPAALSVADMLVAADLRDSLRKIPEDARKLIASKLDSGSLNVRDALALAGTYASEKPAEPETPNGDGARPAKSPSGSHPVKMSELLDIKKHEPARYRKLMADPNFDPSKLR